MLLDLIHDCSSKVTEVELTEARFSAVTPRSVYASTGLACSPTYCP